MARATVPNPFDTLDQAVPRQGPQVQNMRGLAPNTAPIASRPVSSPGVNTGTPGPAPRQGFMSGLADTFRQRLTPPPAQPGGVPAAPAAQPGEPIRIGAPTPAPGPAAPAVAPDLYGKEGGGGLEGQIRGALSGMFGGTTSKGFIDRAKQQLGAATEAQRAQAVRRIDENAIGRGLFKSGIPAELAAGAGTAAQGAFASGLSDILNQAEQQDIQGRQFATGQGLNLLQANRAYDQYAQQRADEQAARAGGGGGGDPMITIIDPDTGQAYELPESYLSF